MKVIPQYKVICPYNYDRVIRVTKNNAQRKYKGKQNRTERYLSVKRKDAISLKIKKCVIG